MARAVRLPARLTGRAASPTALRALAPLALMGVIFYLSAQESVGPDLPGLAQVLAHFGEYALLAALWFWALAPTTSARTAAVASFAICVLYAISDEIHQSHVGGRDSDPLDVVVDACGAATAVLLSYAARSRRTARRARAPPA